MVMKKKQSGKEENKWNKSYCCVNLGTAGGSFTSQDSTEIILSSFFNSIEKNNSNKND